MIPMAYGVGIPHMFLFGEHNVGRYNFAFSIVERMTFEYIYCILIV